MIFTQYWFVEFALVVVPCYLILRPPELRRYFLLLACAIFHAHFAGAAGVVPIVTLGIVVYFLARNSNSRACGIGIALCVATLTHLLQFQRLKR